MGSVFGGGPKTPDPPPEPAPLPEPPTEADEEVVQARRDRRRRAALARGRRSTILTSSQGLSESNTAPKTLLGS